MNLDDFAGSINDFISAMTGQEHIDSQHDTYVQHITISEEQQ